MRWLDSLCLGLAVAAGLVLVGLVGLTFVDVILRYRFAAPILGATDVLQMGMVVVISLAFPFTWRAGGHIVVDLVPDYGLANLTRLRDLSVRLIGIVIFVLLAHGAWVRAEDAELFGEATNMIEIPFRPFFMVLSGAAAIQAVVLCVESVRIVAGLPLGLSVTTLAASDAAATGVDPAEL